METATYEPEDASSTETATLAPQPTSRGPLTLHGRVDAWLRTHERTVVLTLLLCAALTRVVYFHEAFSSPVGFQHRVEQSDMHFFDSWARQIHAGDWLSAQVGHPHHAWHRMVAEIHFREHPGELERYQAAAGATAEQAEPSALLWNEWYGGAQFHQSPLYPYMIAATYAGLGDDPRWVAAWQMILGVANLLLLYLITRRYFGVHPAIVALVLGTLYAPLLFYEALLLRTTLIVFFGLLLVALSQRAWDRNTVNAWLLAGCAFGLSLLVKPTFLLLCAAPLLFLALRPKNSPAIRCAQAVALLVGAALPLVPAVARNIALGSGLLSFSSVGSATFVLSSAVDFRPEMPTYLALTHAAEIFHVSGGQFGPAVAATLDTHSGLMSYFLQVAEKFLWAWHWYERPSNSNFYFGELNAPVLAYLPIRFLAIAPLGLAGLLLVARQARHCLPLLLLTAVSFLPLLFFFLEARYRLPFAVALLPFAGLAVCRMVEFGSGRNWGKLGAVLAVLFVVALWTARPLPADVPLIHPENYRYAYSTYYRVEEEKARQGGDFEAAASVVGRSLELQPREIQRLSRTRSPRDEWETQLASFYAVVHAWYAQVLERADEFEQAVAAKNRARELHEASVAASRR